MFHADTPQTRKRAAGNLDRNTKRLRINTGAIQPQRTTSSEPSDTTGSSSWHASSSVNSTDEGGPVGILDEPQTRLYAALSYIEKNRMDLFCWSTVTADDIQRRSLSIWDSIQAASRNYAVGSEEPVSSDTSSLQKGGQPQVTSRHILFMQTVGDVLRNKIFHDDLLARCRRTLPMEHSVDECRAGMEVPAIHSGTVRLTYTFSGSRDIQGIGDGLLPTTVCRARATMHFAVRGGMSASTG